jgi:hypothetical protein
VATETKLLFFRTHVHVSKKIGTGWLNELGSWITQQLIQDYHQYGFVNYKKGALDSQPQVIKFTSCLPMVGGTLWVLRLHH